MGLRHLQATNDSWLCQCARVSRDACLLACRVVVGGANDVRGIVTRKDLRSDFSQDLF